MPRAEKGSLKALSNKIKSKGLQKLKWFCQMCGKQCRDQNGFKCHLTSEQHQRQLMLFAENQGSYLRQFSRDFESHFMHIFKYTFGGKRMRANVVYQEYIKDKGHVHMNSTVWHSLGGFVRYLGDSGKCKIDQDEKGWNITYIDQEEALRKQKLQDKKKQELSDEDRMNEILQRQMQRALEQAGEDGNTELELQEFVRPHEDHKIVFEMAPIKPTKETPIQLGIKKELSPFGKESTASQQELDQRVARDVKQEIKREEVAPPPFRQAKKRSALYELREQEERFKERRNRKDHWLHEGIIVKIVTKKLGSEFYKTKGEVVKLTSNYSAEIETTSGDVIKFDQDGLETVIPAIGRDMLIVNGAYRGTKVVLEEILEDRFMLRLSIKEGTRNGREIEVPYEDASKLAT